MFRLSIISTFAFKAKRCVQISCARYKSIMAELHTNVERDSKYICDICGVTTNTYHDLQAHLRGRSHLETMYRSETARRSVYIRGFPISSTIESDLQELLGQFGGVTNVVVRNSQHSSGSYALAEFASEGEALKALQHSPPLKLGGRTLAVRPRKVNPVKRSVTFGQKHRLQLDHREIGATPPSVSMMDTDSDGEIKMDQELDAVSEAIGGIKLPKQCVEAVMKEESVNAQLQALAMHCQLGAGAVDAQLIFSRRLQGWLGSAYPGCLVVPFGAPVSGHSTLSSDCDLSLLTHPLPREKGMFSGPTYFSQRLHQVWSQLEVDGDGKEEVLAVSTQFAGHFTQHGPSYGPILALLKEREDCQKVLAIPHARCPIIRFIYSPLNLHCDLSINNRLGPANTRLMAAYFQFDSRMAVLVPTVRVWARAQAVRRAHLNNYALSLMLIHFLQNLIPPVLPCLQDPGMWPRDMGSVGAKGFAPQQALVIDGWNCDFVPPQFLLPSTNTSTPAELFLGFLEYYAEKFPYSKYAVAIHCRSPPLISQLSKGSAKPPLISQLSKGNAEPPLISQLSKGSAEPSLTLQLSKGSAEPPLISQLSQGNAEPPLISQLSKGSAEQVESCTSLQTNSAPSNSRARFRESSLCVQDPFEHVHNVAKNMSKGPFTCFHQNLKSSYVKLKELLDAEGAGEGGQEDLFSLFHQSCKSASKGQKPPSRNLSLTMDAMQYVLHRTAPHSQLTHRLRELDLNNGHTRQLLGSIVLRGLSSILVDDFQFNATLETVERSTQEAQPGSPSQFLTASHSPMQTEESNSCQQRKRKCPTEASEAGLGDSTSQDGEDKSDGNKRQKLTENALPVDELLSQLSEGMQDSVIVCTAYTETWIHCRRRKRKKEHLSSPSNSVSKTVGDLADSLPPIPPCLVFTMALSEPAVSGSSSENTLTITLSPADIKYSHSLSQFFGFFKKWLLCIPPFSRM